MQLSCASPPHTWHLAPPLNGLVFACLSNLFFTPSNITNLLVQSGTNAIIAIFESFHIC